VNLTADPHTGSGRSRRATGSTRDRLDAALGRGRSLWSIG
jgi:hypothetical protein